VKAREFACNHLEKLRTEQRRLDQSAFGLARGFSLRQRIALASWLCFERGDVEDLTPDLDAIIGGKFMIPGDVIPNVVRDEARRMRKAWEQEKAQAAASTAEPTDAETAGLATADAATGETVTVEASSVEAEPQTQPQA
jgi:hypothetical protein